MFFAVILFVLSFWTTRTMTSRSQRTRLRYRSGKASIDLKICSGSYSARKG